MTFETCTHSIMQVNPRQHKLRSSRRVASERSESVAGPERKNGTNVISGKLLSFPADMECNFDDKEKHA